jgi:flagellar protein FliS
MNAAKGALNRGDFAGAGESISKAMKIIDGLDVLLDHEAGGDIASNLSRLYEYMTTLLLQANIRRDSQLISEASALLGEIREGWAAIPEDAASELG